MNYATKLCIVSMVSVFSVSSIGLVQAADTPIVSTGGAAYNIGYQEILTLLIRTMYPLVDKRVLVMAIPIKTLTILMQRAIILPLVGYR